MKFKLLPVIFASMMLVSCGAGENPSSSVPADSSTSQPAFWHYLGFLNDKQVRFDLFDMEEGLQISYGNQALTGINNLATIADTARMTINKNLDPEVKFHMVIVAEKQKAENAYVQVYKAIEADHLMEFFTESCGDDLVGYDRGYITFTIGETPKWTKGLNEKMDEALEAFCR